MCIHQMTSVRRSISPADDHVGMNLRRTILQRHISGKHQNFDLLVEWELPVLLRLPVEAFKVFLRSSYPASQVDR
jgi:hypothetical protein